MKGYWLTRSDGIFATHLKPYNFDKLCLSCSRKGKSRYKLFFIPLSECTSLYRERNIPVEEDVEDILDLLDNNVSFNNYGDDEEEEDPLKALLDKLLKKARKLKILKETKLIGERLLERKKLLYYLWTEKFFDCFSNHFGKLKNVLVEMHLSDLQIKAFNLTLLKCLENMLLDLNSIYDNFRLEKLNED